MTFKDAATEWLMSSKKELANSTYKGYEWYLKKHILPIFGDKQIDKILPLHIQRFANILNEKYAPATTNKILNLMSIVIDYSISILHVANINPCKSIKRSKVSNNKAKTWSEEEIQYFLNLDIVKSSPYYDMLMLSFITAMRPSEVCGLSENDLTCNGSIMINRGLDRYGVITNLKTSSSHRLIDLPVNLYKLLKHRIVYKKEQKMALGEKYIVNDFLFTQPNGAFIKPDTYSKAFKKLIKKHNDNIEQLKKDGSFKSSDKILTNIRLYDIRHSFATNMLMNNTAPVKVISEVMGHSTIKTTLHNYAHVTQTMHKDAIYSYADKIL